MFMPFIFHGRQTSEWIHPKRALVIKRMSSVWGVMGYTRGGERFIPRNALDILFIPTVQPTLFDDTSGGQWRPDVKMIV